MGTMTQQPAQPFAPPESAALAAQVSAAVWYPFHVGVGTAETCKLGRGPALALAGTPGTEWSAAWGAFRPNGTDHVWTSPVHAELSAIFNLSTLLGQEILIGFEVQHDGDSTGVECLLTWGVNSGAVGRKGMLTINLNAVEQLSAEVRGEQATASATGPIPNSATTGVSARQLVVLSLTTTNGTLLDIEAFRYVMGTGPGSAGLLQLGMLDNGGIAPPSVDGTAALTLCARRGASSSDRFMGSAASSASINNFWAARLNAEVAGAANLALSSMVAAPREFPASLRASA